MSDQYSTIKTNSEGIYKEKGSKFIARAFEVNNEQEVKEKLEDLRKEFYDARHHCYAYCLDKNGEKYRANDDGEPNHSAGDPILGQIRSKELTNVLIVVIRYFGGTKLGVGGLIHAYKAVSKEALEQTEIITKYWKKELKITFHYDNYSDMMARIKSYDAEIISQEYSENQVNMHLMVRESFVDFFEL